MGDIFERLGNLLSEKIKSETTESNQNPESTTENTIDDEQIKIEKENQETAESEISLTEEELSLLKSKLSNKKAPTAERIPAGTYIEDIPVKIVRETQAPQ